MAVTRPRATNALYVNSIGYDNTASGFQALYSSTGSNTSRSAAPLEAALRPATTTSDPDKIPQFGLIGEEVEKVDRDLVMREEDGKIATVRYEAVNAMLLNEFLKAYRKSEEEGGKVEEQCRVIEELKGLVATQQKQIEKLSAGLQQVSDKVELTRAAPKVVASN